MSDLTMRIAGDGTITWSEPRSPAPFMINLFGCVGEKLLRTDVPEGQDSIADCSDGKNRTVKVEPGTYNVVGDQLFVAVYVNIIEVGVDGAVTEKKALVG